MFVKKNHGIDYLYSLAGKKQFFLGRKDDIGNVNHENLKKALSIINKNFDRQLEKYIDDLKQHVSYMEKHDKAQHITIRKNHLISKFQHVK